MKYPIVLASILFAGYAYAQTSQDFVFFDAQIAALQHRIDASATGTTINHEALQSLQGKQQELTNQEAKLKVAGTMTADEKSALALSIREQQRRVSELSHAGMPEMKHVDPASVPAPTYVTPDGMTISSAPGTTPQQNGVVPLAGPTVPVIHAPMPVTTTPAQ